MPSGKNPGIPTTPLAIIVLVLLPLLIYWQIGGHDYISYDDPIVINNERLKRPLTISNLSQAISSPSPNIPYQMPLPLTAFMVAHNLPGTHYSAYHYLSLMFHILNGLLLFGLLRKCTGRFHRSLWVAALWSVHPLNVEPVCWIAATNGLMATFFFLLALWAYAAYGQRPSAKAYLLTLVAFSAGLLCKPIVITLPLVLLLFDFWPLERNCSLWPQKTPNIPVALGLILEKIPFALISICYLLAPLKARSWASFKILPAGQDIHIQALAGYPERLAKLFFPFHLSLKDVLPSASDGQILGAGLILVVISGGVLYLASKQRRWRYLVTGWFWFLLILFPAVLMTALSQRPLGDRFTYLPGIGIFIILVWLTADLVKNRDKARILSLVAGVVLLTAGAVLSFYQAQLWQNSQTLYRHALRLDPDNQRARFNLADVLLAEGRLSDALRHYRYILRHIPEGAAQAHHQIGRVYARQKKWRQAQSHYQQALARRPDYAVAHNNLANLLSRRQELDRALHHYQAALRLKPEAFQVHNNLATVLIQKGQYEQARRHLQQALALNPDYRSARKNLRYLQSLLAREPAPLNRTPKNNDDLP